MTLQRPIKTAIIGAKGYIGSYFHARNPDSLVTHKTEEKGYIKLDLETYRSLDFSLEGYTHAVLCAAVSHPLICELEEKRTTFINVEQTLKLAYDLIHQGVTPIFISSDYIFDDEGHKKPMNSYGRQKLAIEEALDPSQSIIARCTKIYGTDKGDHTLFDLMAEQLTNGETLRAATDQFFAPIHIDDLIGGIQRLQVLGETGVYDFSSSDMSSRFTMAQWMVERLGGGVEPISLDDLQDGIKRPKKSFLRSLPHTRSWRVGLQAVIENYSLNLSPK